jgi:membrane protease subunit (stomatin/prohibitin family)
MMYRVPRNIRLNDNIVVREDEFAVFYRDGKALAYIDRPDRYALTSLNAPVVGRIVELLSGVKQYAEVYYIQKRPFDGKFGSKQPYQFRDKEFGIVNLRLFGDFRYRIIKPDLFINQFVGTFNFRSSAEVESRLKEQMVLLMYDAIGKMKERGMGVVDLAANLTTIEQIVLEKSKDHFELYGVEIQKIASLYVSMPDEVQKAVDSRASMQVLGTDYMGYQTAQAVREAARNPSQGGGLAGAGVGFGAGMGMGYTMMDTMGRGGRVAGAPGGMSCSKCGGLVPAGARFCPSCGGDLSAGGSCVSCKKPIPADADFCPACGSSQKSKCGKCGASMDQGANFCPKCGEKQTDGAGKCPACGNEISGNVSFCPKCGKKIN